jgi:hypothetical protein
LISTPGSGQLKLAIDTHAKAVMLPIPWDIIKAGGIIIDSGLIVEAKANFKNCTNKRRVMIKIICLEEILGFSFFETNIKIPELISASAKVKSQEKISEIFKGKIRSNLKEEIIATKMQIKKIMRLSIFEILLGCLIGT